MSPLSRNLMLAGIIIAEAYIAYKKTRPYKGAWTWPVSPAKNPNWERHYG